MCSTSTFFSDEVGLFEVFDPFGLIPWVAPAKPTYINAPQLGRMCFTQTTISVSIEEVIKGRMSVPFYFIIKHNLTRVVINPTSNSSCRCVLD